MPRTKQEQKPYDIKDYVKPVVIHELKIKCKYMHDIEFGNKKGGKKRFELRKDDRNYQPGDLVHFTPVDWKEEKVEYHCNTGLWVITYVLRDVPEYGLKKGYCIFGFERVTVGGN